MTSSDRRLVERARYGDTDAVAEIYGRYGDRVFGLCLTLLRDRDAAADATQDTFLAAWERIEQLRDPDKLRPWLFAIARNRVIGRSRSDAKATPTEEVLDVAVDDQTADALHAAALGRLMWDAAEGLEERDRLLLELSVRQGLEGGELAEAMGIPPSRAYTLTNRVKGRIERALGALLVARLGREDCDDLGALLEGWDGRFGVSVRRRVVRHVDDCALCSERRATLIAPASLFGALPIVAAPSVLRDPILTGYSLGTSPSTPDLLDDWDGDGWPPSAGSERGAVAAEVAAYAEPAPFEEPDDPMHRRRGMLVLAAAVVFALLAGATAVIAGGDDEGDIEAARIANADADLVDPIVAPAGDVAPTTILTVTGPTAEVAAQEASAPTTIVATTTSPADTAEEAAAPPTSAPAAAAPPTTTPAVAAPPTIQPSTPTIVPEPTVTVGTTAPPVEPTTTTTVDDISTTTTTEDTTTTTETTQPQGGRLAVTPGTLTAEPGGTVSFRISNGGPGRVTWSASPSVGFGVSPSSGPLSSGGSTTVTVSVGSRASSGTVTINGGISAVSVTIIVASSPPPPPSTTLGLTAPTTEAEGRARIENDDFDIEIGQPGPR